MDFEQTKSGLLIPTSFADSRRPEMREVATTRDGRDITRGYVDPLMLQQPTDSVLRLRGNGDYEIYKEVLRDDQVASCFAQRRLAVVACELQVDAGGTGRADKKAADFMREQLDGMAFDKATDKMLYGVYYGYAAAEIMWGRDGNNVVVDEIKVRDRRRFGFDGYGQLRLKTNAAPDGELLPPKKFWSFCTGADHDDEPYGLGLAHWLYWPVFFKRAGIQYWMVFLERFGQPTTVGKHPVNATPQEKQKLLDALEAIATDTGITIPQGMEVEFLEAARSGTADYVQLCEYMDAAITKIILGQTASTQGTPGRLGNDDLQGDVRADLIRADADLVCESFNHSAVEWLTEWNFPGAKPPRVFRVTDPEEDLTQRADRDTKIYNMGFKPTLEYIREQYGEGWEEQEPTPPGTDNPQTEKDPQQKTAPGEPAPVLNADGADPVQQTALNGAQIKSLSDVISLVQQGQLDRDRAKALIEVGFPAISPAQIERLLGDAVKKAALVPKQEPAAGAQFADSPGADTLELFINELQRRAGPITGGWIDQVRELVMSAESFEAMLDGLLALDMPLDEMTDALSSAMRAATLAGQADALKDAQ